LGGGVAEEEIECRGAWELWSPSESAEPRIEGATELIEAGIEQAFIRAPGRGRIQRRPELIDHVVSRLNNLGAVRLPRSGELLEDLAETRTAPTAFRRKVRAAEEGLPVGRQPH